MPNISLVIDFLLRLRARRKLLTAAEPVNPRRANHPISIFIVLGRISRNWGPLGCWTIISYYIVKTGHGANIFRSLSNRFAESTFLVRLLSYLFRWFGHETGSIDHVADTIEHVGIFFKHAGAAFKSAKDVVTKIIPSSTVSDENNTASNSADPGNSIADGAVVDSPKSDTDDVQRIFSRDHSARADAELLIISSIEEAEGIITQWKEGSAGFRLDVPLDMSAQIAKDLMTYFIRMDAVCLLEDPNLKSILEKELASAQLDLEAATKSVADLHSLVHPPSSTDRKMDS